tara:strand:+ start:76 stop:1053 length:978 start_codon:yes stop_codon:yes gene_type:complete
MSFFTKIKSIYNIKSLNECIENNNYKDFPRLFDALKEKDPVTYSKFLKFNTHNFIENEELNTLFKKSFIWVNSFNLNDVLLLNNFIIKFLAASKIETNVNNFYEKTLSCLTHEDVKDYPVFNDLFLKSHYYFHKLIENSSKTDLNILNTRSAFFEYQKKIFFTHHKLTRCFFYIVKHPYDIFLDLKKQGKSSQESLSILCNLDQRPNIVKINFNNEERSCEENTRSWSTNVSSWTNANVVSTLRGLVIKYDDLINKKEEVLLDVAAHLKESGIDVNFTSNEIIDLAKSFNFLVDTKNNHATISNQDKKIIDRDCGEMLDKYLNEL